MNKLKLVDTAALNPAETDTTLVDYWRRKFDTLQDESTPATIRSLRSQLRSIQEITDDPDQDQAETLRRILIHVGLGLAVSKQAETVISRARSTDGHPIRCTVSFSATVEVVAETKRAACEVASEYGEIACGCIDAMPLMDRGDIVFRKTILHGVVAE